MEKTIQSLISELSQTTKVFIAVFLAALEYSIFKPFFGTNYFEYQPVINTVVMLIIGTVIGTFLFYLTKSILSND
jgi:hypothetical protein